MLSDSRPLFLLLGLLDEAWVLLTVIFRGRGGVNLEGETSYILIQRRRSVLVLLMMIIQLQGVIIALMSPLMVSLLRLMLDQASSTRKLEAKVDLERVLTRCDRLLAGGQASARRLL